MKNTTEVFLLFLLGILITPVEPILVGVVATLHRYYSAGGAYVAESRFLGNNIRQL